jgi:hypothetical protein
MGGLGIGIICAPFISAALLGLGWAGRVLLNLARRSIR